jgi:hypothetical protein
MGDRGTVDFAVIEGDITTVEADVVCLKFAQRFYNADKDVAQALGRAEISEAEISPAEGRHSLVATGGKIGARAALFVGVPPLYKLGYPEIRQFAATALTILADEAPATRTVALTVHGPEFGLDEVESARAELAGLIDATQQGHAPPALESVVIVDRNHDRVQRLRAALQNVLGDAGDAPPATSTGGAFSFDVPGAGVAAAAVGGRAALLQTAGRQAQAKPSAFVAMPFAADFEDIFYFGIQDPVHRSDLLCERVDQAAFIGDILQQVRQRIDAASVVIADLTGANANVYLEVGYAWGQERPTILLAKESEELKFDVRGQRCLKYRSIRHLAETLAKELQDLRGQGVL